MKVLQAFEIQGTIYPTTPRKTPDELNISQKRCEKLNLAVRSYADTQTNLSSFIQHKISSCLKYPASEI